MTERVLLIEDDIGMYRILIGSVTQLGFELCQELDGISGLERALEENFALVIIDGNLPRLNGFDVCRRLRDKKRTIPIIMLTSRTDEIDRIVGIEFGADDYITKPFSVRELATRIKGLLRRASYNQVQTEDKRESDHPELPPMQFGKLKIDPATSKVKFGSKELDLTSVEYKLLLLLASHPGKLFSRDELAAQVWGLKSEPNQPTVTVMISRLRAKLEPNPASPQFIHTVRGLGYRFTEIRS